MLVYEEVKEVAVLQQDLLKYIDNNPIFDSSGNREKNVEKRLAAIAEYYNIQRFNYR